MSYMLALLFRDSSRASIVFVGDVNDSAQSRHLTPPLNSMPPRTEFISHQEWAVEVNLELAERTTTHPILEDLKEKSRLIPHWLTDKDSTQYAYHRTPYFEEAITGLVDTIAILDKFSIMTDDSEDPQLSADLAYSMREILILAHMNERFGVELAIETNEADRRHPIDAVCNPIWTLYSGNKFLPRMESPLQAPKMPRGHYVIRPDVSVFIELLLFLQGRPKNVRRACSSSAFNSNASINNILHWVTEYNKHGNSKAPKEQVLEGLVTALYQRRALGFVDHFVFGMIHYDKTMVDIIAATWEPIDSTNLDSKLAGEASDQACPGASGSSDPSPSNNTEGSAIPDTLDPEVKKVLEKRKIVYYKVATWDMDVTSDILSFFLFVRRAQKLGLTYRQDIERNYKARVSVLMRLAKNNYEWAIKPPGSSGSRSRGSSKRSRSEVDVPPTVNEQHLNCGGPHYSNLSAMFSQVEEQYDSDESNWDSNTISEYNTDARREYYMDALRKAHQPLNAVKLEANV